MHKQQKFIIITRVKSQIEYSKPSVQCFHFLMKYYASRSFVAAPKIMRNYNFISLVLPSNLAKNYL